MELESLKTVRDWVRYGVSLFNQAKLHFGHGTDNALDEAAFLIAHQLHLELPIADLFWDARVTPFEGQQILELLERRVSERIPASYLTGRAWFAGLEFEVDARVLIPRSPLAELILNGFQPWIGEQHPARVLDLCTGSGCIGLAVAAHFADTQVDLADLDEGALDVARRNRQKLQLEEQTEIIQSDLFKALKGREYDLILSNPPYVSAEELAGLPEEYGHEPRVGLAGGDNGLDLVLRILRDAPDYLRPNGLLIVEVGSAAERLAQQWPEVPFTWLEFERGGEGVFLLTGRQLNRMRGML